MADMSEIENLLRNDPELLPKVQSILNRRRRDEQQERRDRRDSSKERLQQTKCAQWTSNIDCESPSTDGKCTWDTSLNLCMSCPNIGFQECIRSHACEWKDGACAPKTFLMDE